MIYLKITNDFETRSEAELKMVGAFEYSMHPSTIATCYGIHDPETNKVHLLKFHQMQKKFFQFPEAFKKKWLYWINDKRFIFKGHNAFFEQCIYNNVLVRKFGWPKIPADKWECSASEAAACAIPRNLAGAGAVMDLAVKKDLAGHIAMLKTCKPTAAWSKWYKEKLKMEKKGYVFEKPEPQKFLTPESHPEVFETLYSYCIDDVWTEVHLDEALPRLHPFERKVWLNDQRLNFHGVTIDVPLVKKIYSIMEKESKTMSRELDELTMGLVSSGNARNQIIEFLKLEGLEVPDLKAKTVDDFLQNGKATGDTKKLLELRKALSKTSTKKYKKFMELAATDGRCRDIVLYCGASTGRWGGKNIQPQNFPRGIIKDIHQAIEYIKNEDVEMLKLIYGENLMPLFSSVLRGMFIATEGHTMVCEDWNAIETRVLWWLAGHTEGLKFFFENRDPYKELASKIFNKPVLEITDDERQVGKAAVLGCGYQMGWKNFIQSAWDVYRAKVDKETAKIAVSAYREIHAPVTELWRNYQNAAIYATENPGATYEVGPVKFKFEKSFLWVELPSGRKLAYKDAHVKWVDVVIQPDEDALEAYKEALNAHLKNPRGVAKPIPPEPKKFRTKQLRFYAVNHKVKKGSTPIDKWARESIYGGKWAENIVQAVSRDLLAATLLRIETLGFKALMHAHDELVAEKPNSKIKLEKDDKGNLYCPEFRTAMETLPDWASGLPLKASGWAGARYKKG